MITFNYNTYKYIQHYITNYNLKKQKIRTVLNRIIYGSQPFIILQQFNLQYYKIKYRIFY